MRPLRARRGRRDALAALRAVYDARPDLQEVFPEAADGDLTRLIDWAAAVSGGAWSDPARPLLEHSAAWYAASFSGAAPPPPSVDWPALERSSAAAANPLPATLAAMRVPPHDVGEHLPALSLLVTELGLRNILELGVRTGVSTVALLEAAARVGGRVVSVDVEPCPQAHAAVESAGLAGRWEFVLGSDLELPEAAIPSPLDLVFVDTTHLYDHTVAELRRFCGHLRDGGWIALHDYTSSRGVARAVHEHVERLGRRARFYPFVHQFGLALIRVSVDGGGGGDGGGGDARGGWPGGG